MTPSGMYQGKISGKAPAPRWLHWVPAATMVGGIFAALVAYYLQKKDLAEGLGWGSVLFTINFYSLKILTEKVLSRDPHDGRKFFWFWNCIRWFFLAAACWIFLSVSPTCLAGAGISYFWFLLVLSWVGWTFAQARGDKQNPNFF